MAPTTASRPELAPVADTKYFAFVDPAGGSGTDSVMR
jgi:hypothetical protein